MYQQSNNYLQERKSATLARPDEDEQLYDDNPSDEEQQCLHNSTNTLSKHHKKKRSASTDYAIDNSSEQQVSFLAEQRARKAKLAMQEKYANQRKGFCSCCSLGSLLIILPLLIVTYLVLIYVIPFIKFDAQVAQRPPLIPFNFNSKQLKPIGGENLRIERLFAGQLHGPEALAIDSSGNMFTATEGGFVLYAHLNKSSPFRRHFIQLQQNSAETLLSMQQPQANLVKIADLNQATQTSNINNTNKQQIQQHHQQARKACQLDEQVYGKQPQAQANGEFSSTITYSRCSKPLGVRLSPDENYLYVIDSLRGLFKIHLRQAERLHSPMRLVTRLVDFKSSQVLHLPVYDPAFEYSFSKQSPHRTSQTTVKPNQEDRQHLNVTLMAVDDLVIDYHNPRPLLGTNSSTSTANNERSARRARAHQTHNSQDAIIYMSVASQSWHAISVVYEFLEANPSGMILRFDTFTGELSVLDPCKVSHVRYSTFGDRQFPPRFDEEDSFDNRPQFFPNGIELTDDGSALLIAESLNKRIIKHYIRGPRAGDSDLWAWLPNVPDNLRRSTDTDRESYWTVGCADLPLGTKDSPRFDIGDKLSDLPMLRKLIAKHTYFIGASIEFFGSLIRSTPMINLGYTLKTGESITPFMCGQMLALKFNSSGEIESSIHSSSLPSDFLFFSHIVDMPATLSSQRVYYLGSPTYDYIGKLTVLSNSNFLTANDDNSNN